MEERQEEECTIIASYLAGSGPGSVPKDNDHVFSKGSVGKFGGNLSRYGQFNIVKLQNTRGDFECFQMKEIEDIDSFMNQVMFLVY